MCSVNCSSCNTGFSAIAGGAGSLRMVATTVSSSGVSSADCAGVLSSDRATESHTDSSRVGFAAGDSSSRGSGRIAVFSSARTTESRAGCTGTDSAIGAEWRACATGVTASAAAAAIVFSIAGISPVAGTSAAAGGSAGAIDSKADKTFAGNFDVNLESRLVVRNGSPTRSNSAATLRTFAEDTVVLRSAYAPINACSHNRLTTRGIPRAYE